jgi:predicted transcriptional regulator
VLTLLQRLEAKGYVASDKTGLAHVFRAQVSRDRLLRQRLKDLANQLCEGTPAPLVLALVENQHFSAVEIEQFRRLLDRLEQAKRKETKS